ncbi:MAG: GPW/gp25 family protein [Pleurocapsa sp. SU_196_0]|nr:GPW/gp25 family protein [Pleurocapsa sp. SU_196_0]
MATTWYGLGTDRLEGGRSRDSSGRELIRAGIRRLLRTKPGEYPSDPNMGNQAWRYLHRPLTSGVLVLIGYSCLEVIARYEDRVRVNLDEDVPPVILDDEQGSICVSVEYQWADNLEYDVLGVRFPLRIGGEEVEFDTSLSN